MKISLITLLTAILITVNIPDEAVIVHKSKKIGDAKSHTVFKWDEISLKNKPVEEKINKEIRKTVLGYQAFDTDEYGPECVVKSAKGKLISCYFSVYVYNKGAAHGWSNSETKNFNALTGEEVNFNNLLNKDRLIKADSLVIRRLSTLYPHIDEVYMQSTFVPQLKHLSFFVTSKGITILFRGESYWDSIIDVTLTFKELEPYVNKRGLLSWAYASR